ncbi:MAG: diaminopimelate decarboxylase [Pseudomonadota bacterium]|nr:diaminopimelate decarboxylase [Pseudomonadota bacterium]
MKNNLSKYNRYLRYKNGELFIEDLSLKSISRKYKTPIYCYSVSQIEFNYKLLRDSFKKIRPLICYAMKANFNSYIIKILSKLGAGVDVVSLGELKKSMSNLVKNKKIVFSGVGKTLGELEYAIKKQIKQINVESLEELEEIDFICKKIRKKVDVCLRVNPDIDAKTHDKITTGRSEDKFGIPEENIRDIMENYKNNELINITGLSVHIGSQIERLEPFRIAFKKIRKQILNLRMNGCKIKKLDLGGGIGIAYSDKSKVVDIKQYAELIEDFFSDLDLEIIIEPGRYLVGASGIILSKVIRIKEGKNKRFVIIDAGMNNIIRPALYGVYHNIIPTNLKDRVKEKVDIVGPICETGDFFAKDIMIKKLSKDDLVVICSAGAYSSCMASKYNLRDEAKEIFVKKKTIR